MNVERRRLARSVRLLIDASPTSEQSDETRDKVLVEIANYQRSRVDAFDRLCRTRKKETPFRTLTDVPALPTDVFRFVRVASHDENQAVRVFRSSGTTAAETSCHSFCDLDLYDHAARTAAKYAIFPDVERMRLVFLAPDEQESPHSSLSYMLSRFADWFGSAESRWVSTQGGLDIDELTRVLRDCENAHTPVAILATSFALLHADDALASRRFSLPNGSRIMQTGGFKGRSREVAPDDMRALLSARYDVSEAMIVAEYGMTELSSQMYELTLRQALLGEPAVERCYWTPGWVRTTPVHAETLEPVAFHETGLLRIDDAANLDSVAFVQTSDLARRTPHGFQLLGRASSAVARGCSLAIDDSLGPLPR